MLLILQLQRRVMMQPKAGKSARHEASMLVVSEGGGGTGRSYHLAHSPKFAGVPFSSQEDY